MNQPVGIKVSTIKKNEYVDFMEMQDIQIRYLQHRYFYIYQQGDQTFYYDSYNNHGKGITKMHLMSACIDKFGYTDNKNPIKKWLGIIDSAVMIRPINLHYDFYRPKKTKVVYVRGHCFPNLWRKPDVESDSSISAEPFIAHLTKMMGCKAKANYLIDMIAYRYQKSCIDSKPHIAFYLYGEKQGMGKGLLGETLEKVFGVSAVRKISNKKDFESMSSIDLWRKTWLIAEETSCKVGSNTYQIIKGHTGTCSFSSARKGEHFDIYEIPAQLFMFSNHAPTFLESGDRRFFVSKWQYDFDKNKEDKNIYFAGYNKWLKERGGYEAIAGLLTERDVSNVQLEAPAMVTPEKREILSSIQDPVVEEMKLIMGFQENKDRKIWIEEDFKSIFQEYNIKASQIPHKFREAGLHTSGKYRYKSVHLWQEKDFVTKEANLRFYVKQECRIEHIQGIKPSFINDKGERTTLSELPEYNDCIYLKVSYRDGPTRQF